MYHVQFQDLHISKHTGAKHTATVLFFHGSGSNGMEMRHWVRIMAKDFTFPHVDVLYPTAPVQPYSPGGGGLSNVWFDRASMSPTMPEKLQSINYIQKEINKHITKQNEAGIPTNRIVVGGFSMGGGLAFHVGLRWHREMAGTFAFSSFLNEKSIVYTKLKTVKGPPVGPVLLLHGDKDDVVDISVGQQTCANLQAAGAEVQFHTLPGLGHGINKPGMTLIKEFIEKQLPEI